MAEAGEESNSLPFCGWAKAVCAIYEHNHSQAIARPEDCIAAYSLAASEEQRQSLHGPERAERTHGVSGRTAPIAATHFEYGNERSGPRING